ncbi:ABC-F family ATP-binding cassette domain-containing protein [Microbacterium azadirachtae]|uniref:ABC-F family ATP-binding cassette domain-containing protein n=1 Tax=Microbacterium azadirachtae TaxID=582680 RepID=UPI00087FFFFE|nr:ABC-F family ATP-binding cassette domain-containing protein [Microbacterium azadirachtae]SDM30446.1 ATPase components of ABC transporters with duplicated ATPase domains [Microbacterium azadirachtae]SEG47254.1 ATPase components of ABC transporters with duplicated ATPase domains [Microbacterium azadirachtae]SEG52392.1 ATPase components of ABC transporters with duplicated ATPase domains [Microbacterium azadirachtae]
MAHLLGAEGLHLEFPTRVVFDSVTLGIEEGDRIGIVGRNGDGKSSLLAMLAGRLEPDAGRVTVRGGTTIGVLDQADVLDDALTVGRAIVGDTPEHEWAGDATVRDVIDGLVSDLDWDASVADLSGGQRRRVALAKLLAGDWDIVALDEPTNHLDVEAIGWLAEHLKRRWPANQGALMVVTHDRWFLDEVCTETWEVHDRIVEPFEGGYAAYILQRVERDRMAAATEAKRQNLARKELAWLRRGAPARTSKPKFRIDAANALIADVPEIRDRIGLQSLAVSRLGKDVVDLIDAGVTFPATATAPERTVLRDVEWRIAPGERTGILGVNGAGKSTLLSLVAGTLAPTSGRVTHGKTVQVRTLTQRLDELQDVWDEPVRVVIGRLRTTYTFGTGSKAAELTPGQLLERLGFSSAQLSTPVKDLSGGQQRRLQLLLVLLDQPNVMILDEPTNDMDTDMLAAIEDLLDSWPGTLLVVSHDRYFLERVTDQQYAILGGHLRHLPGGVDEYLRLRALEQAAPKDTVTAPGSTPTAAGSALAGADRRAAEKEVSALERRMQKLAEQIDRAKHALADHDQSDYAGLGEKMKAIQEQQDEVDELELRWFELTEQLG